MIFLIQCEPNSQVIAENWITVFLKWNESQIKECLTFASLNERFALMIRSFNERGVDENIK